MVSIEDNKTLNRDKFNSMSIPEQIQIVNKLIKLGDSITNIAKMLGYNETTLRDRYKRAGYSRLSKRGIFVPNDQLEQSRAEQAKTEGTKNKETTKNHNRNKSHKNNNIKQVTVDDPLKGQENLLNTIELGDNIFKLLPASKGVFSTALELNNAVKRNINIRTSKELSRKVLSIYNFLASVEPEAGDAVNYTSIITGALSLYFDKLQDEYGDIFNSYVIGSEADTPNNNNHHKAITELLELINGK